MAPSFAVFRDSLLAQQLNCVTWRLAFVSAILRWAESGKGYDHSLARFP